jgi:glutamate racemase
MESATTRRAPHHRKRTTEILGIFDSGLGGLTVLRSLRGRVPNVDVVYLADQAHVPYGDRSNEDLVQLLRCNVEYLETAGVSAIVMGCNTSCAVAAKFGYPPSSVPIFDLIEAVAGSVASSGARRIGVVATAATIRSGAYGEAIRRIGPHLDVQEVAAPALVPLVEAGNLSGPEPRAAIAAAHASFKAPLDALILACTHYPLLDAQFAAIFGPGVARIDPAEAQAERAAKFARAAGLAGSARTRYLTTGALEPFRGALESLVGPLGPRDEIAALHPASEAYIKRNA